MSRSVDVGALSRRTFLKVGTAAGGGLMLSFHVPVMAQEATSIRLRKLPIDRDILAGRKIA